MHARTVSVVATLVTCCSQDRTSATLPSSLTQATSDPSLSVTQLSGTPPGLSGLTIDERQRIWAVPERDRLLVELRPDVSTPKRMIPIHGIPPNVDLESLAFVAPNRLAVGTESNVSNRSQDPIYFLDVQENLAQVRGSTLAFDYGRFGLSAPTNTGVEGLCFTGGAIYAVAELTLEHPRRAPVIRFDLQTHESHTMTLALTTERGKISGLACRTSSTGLEFLAIERHYEVSRVLVLEGSNLERSRIFDLAKRFSQNPPNFEGIEWWGDEVMIVSDDQNGRVQVPGFSAHFRGRP